MMKICSGAFGFMKDMAKNGNPNSISDVGVGVLCLVTAIKGAYLNVKINCQGFEDEKYVTKIMVQGQKIVDKAEKEQSTILKLVDKIIVK